MNYERNNSSFESVSSVLRRDEEKRQEKEDNKKDNFIDLDSLYKLYINADAIKKYEDKFAQLSHIDKNANKLRGYMYFMNSTGKKGDLVAFISVKLESGKTWVDTLEVTPDYRGNKISHQLLDVACNEFGATDIRVNKNNERAIRVFKKYGFIEYDKKDQWLYMSNDSVTTSNPVQKHDTKAAQETAVSLAMEAIFGKPSKEKLIEDAMKKISKKIKTNDDKVAFKNKLTENEKTFKATLSSLKTIDKKLEKGTIAPKDYEKQRKLAYSIMKKTMIEFNVNINNLIDNAKKPTMDEYNDILPIISEIKSRVSKLKLINQTPAQEGILGGTIAAIVTAPIIFAGFCFAYMDIKSKIDKSKENNALKKHPQITNDKIEKCVNEINKTTFDIFKKCMTKSSYFNSSEYKNFSKKNADGGDVEGFAKDRPFSISETDNSINVTVESTMRSPTYTFEYPDEDGDEYVKKNISPLINKIQSNYTAVLMTTIKTFNSVKSSIETKYNCKIDARFGGLLPDGDGDISDSTKITDYEWFYATIKYNILFND